MPVRGPDHNAARNSVLGVAAITVVIVAIVLIMRPGDGKIGGPWRVPDSLKTENDSTRGRLGAFNYDPTNWIFPRNGYVGPANRKPAAGAPAVQASPVTDQPKNWMDAPDVRHVSVHARMLAQRTDKPIAGAMVWLETKCDLTDEHWAKAGSPPSGPDGKCSMSIPALPGYNFKISGDGPIPYVLAESAERRAKLANMSEEELKDEVVLHFAEGAMLRGSVTWSTGEPVKHATLDLHLDEAAGPFVRQFSTGETGKFEIAVPRKSAGEIVCSNFAGEASQVVLIPEAGDPPEIKFVLTKKTSIAGTVKKSDGSPAPAGISIVGIGPTQFMARTDMDGAFKMTRLEAGKYSLNIKQTPDSNAFGGDPVQVEIAAGEDKTGVELKLVEGETIDVVVLDKDSAPIPDAIAQWQAQVGGKAGGAKSDATGRLQVSGIPPNGMLANLVISHEGYQTETRRDIHPLDGDQQIILQKSNSIALVVKWKSDESPVTSYAYRLLKSGWNDFEIDAGLQQNRVNDPDGRTTLKEIVSGKWRIEVTVLDETGVATTLREASEFDLDNGEENHEVVVKLAGGKSIDGVVTLHSDGPPVAGATVRFQPSSQPIASGPPVVPLTIGPQITDAEGRFHFEGIPIGKHVITAEKTDLTLAQPYDLVLPADTKLDSIHLVLEVGGVVFGSIHDSAGKPIASATVMDSFRNPNGGEWTTVNHEGNADGTYYLDGMVPGLHQVNVSKDGYMDNKDVEVLVGEKKEVNFGPTGGVQIHGTIYVSGKPAQTVVFLGGADSESVLCQSAASGGYAAQAPPGIYYCFASGLEGAGEKVIVAPTPDDQTIDLHIDAAEADIVLVFPDDAAFAPGPVTINPRERVSRYQFTRIAMAQASHHVPALVAGEYQATFASKDGIWQGDSGWLNIGPDGANTFTIDVKKIAAGVRVGGWVPNQLNMTFHTLSFDVTDVIKSEGTARALVRYESGRHAVSIAWAALSQDGHEISRDVHDGWSGTDQSNNNYRLQIPTYEAGHSYQLQINLRGDGGGDSQGSVYLSLN